MSEPLKEWLELDDAFLSDATNYYLFVTRYKKYKTRVRKKQEIVRLTGESVDDLDNQLLEFTQRPDVRLSEQA